MWIDNKIEELRDKISELQDEIKVLSDDLMEISENKTFWQNIEYLGIGTDTLDELYLSGELSDDALLRELSNTLTYYERQYEDNPTMSNFEEVRKYRKLMAAVADELEYKSHWCDNVEV